MIVGSDRLNPDSSGRSLPTIIRVYQLREIGSLEQSSFEDIWQRAPEVLGEDLVSQDEVTVYPRQTIERQFERDPAANYIVGVGIFRRPVGTTWRTVLALPTPRSQAQCAARAAGGDEAALPPPVPMVRLFAEDFRLEGTLELQEVSSGGACAPGDLMCTAQSQVPAAPEAPEAPAAPSAPETPSAPAPGAPKTGAR